MKGSPVRNFHLPLPEPVYRTLRREAESAKRPATALARQVIETWLSQRRRATLHEAIAAYAARHAGSVSDLDPALEALALETLRGRRRRRKR